MFAPILRRRTCAVCSGVRRVTPACCCNYFDYTYYGVSQQSGETVQFMCFSILTDKKKKKKMPSGIFDQLKDIHIYMLGVSLSLCVCVCW